MLIGYIGTNNRYKACVGRLVGPIVRRHHAPSTNAVVMHTHRLMHAHTQAHERKNGASKNVSIYLSPCLCV